MYMVLALGRCVCNFRSMIFKLITQNSSWVTQWNCSPVNAADPQWWEINISQVKAIMWVNTDTDLCRHMVSLSHNESTLTHHLSNYQKHARIRLRMLNYMQKSNETISTYWQNTFRKPGTHIDWKRLPKCHNLRKIVRKCYFNTGDENTNIVIEYDIFVVDNCSR